MKITITGSLGNIGRPLTKELIREGHEVTVITSNTEKVKEIESLGAIAAVGKLDNMKFLRESFTGADSVFCMIPPDFSQEDQLLYYQNLGLKYSDAIHAAGVNRVIHLSSYGAHVRSGTGFISGSHRTEQIFNAISNIQLTHIRPTFFYYNLLAFIEMIKSAGFIGAVFGGEDKLAMVSPKDIASAVADELQKTGSPTSISVRYVVSDERTCSQTAEVLGKAIGIPNLKWMALPGEKVLQSLLKRGMSDNVARNLVELGEATHSGLLREDYELHKPEFGTVKLEEYAIEFVEHYRSNEERPH